MDVFWLVYLLVLFAIVGVLLLVAYTRKGSLARIGMTKRRLVLRSAAPPDTVYAQLTEQCPDGYTVADADRGRGMVLLSSRPTLFTWGFFFPAVVRPDGGGTLVELGIKSKLLQYGPLVTRAHRKLADDLAHRTRSTIEVR